MEDSDLQVMSDFEGTETVVNETIENNITEIEDDRIPCSNDESLNKILQITISKATYLAHSHNVENSKSKFVDRFTEVFRDIVHANVCVDGLPWAISFDGFTSRERELQEVETEDARLSKLCKEVERVARKRKTVARECTRIREIMLKHKRQNLRKLNTGAFIPSLPILGLPESFPHQELAEVCRDLNLANMNVERVADELPTLEKNFEMAQGILRRQKECLGDDTGYASS